jgi:Site-specific recombinase XerD
VRSLLNFCGGRRLSLEDITASLMREFESYLIKRRLQKNTISFYMRNLRALYYRAIDEGLLRPQSENPFAHVLTGVYQSRKRALDMKDIQALNRFREKLSWQAGLESDAGHVRKAKKACRLLDAIYYFRFCLEARGMSWVDMVCLKKADIGPDSFMYVRKKTRQQLEIMITPGMREIIAYFRSRTPEYSPYLFPVLDPAKGNERKQYETALRLQNERLREIARLSGIGKTVTTHVSRHSWATIAKREKVDISVISELLGHNSIKTTMRYLASFDKTEMERATEQVTRALKKAS